MMEVLQFNDLILFQATAQMDVNLSGSAQSKTDKQVVVKKIIYSTLRKE
jgi:hypothetical protein